MGGWVCKGYHCLDNDKNKCIFGWNYRSNESLTKAQIMSNSSHTMFLMDLDDVGASDPSICTLHVCCQRPYHVESTGSRPITGVKQRRARLVLGWVTAWEHRVLLNFFIFLISVGFAVDANSRMMIYNNKKKEQEKRKKEKKSTFSMLPFHFQRVLFQCNL